MTSCKHFFRNIEVLRQKKILKTLHDAWTCLKFTYVEKMSIVKENNNQEPAPSKHFVRPLLLAQNSLHVPSHVLLPRGSLFAHPYPESVHPFETHEDQSISELTAKTIARGSHLRLDTNISRRTGEVSKHACDERNIGDFAVKSIPVLPFKVAVFCLILNTITPGAGKFIRFYMIPYPLLNM